MSFREWLCLQGRLDERGSKVKIGGAGGLTSGLTGAAGLL